MTSTHRDFGLWEYAGSGARNSSSSWSHASCRGVSKRERLGQEADNGPIKRKTVARGLACAERWCCGEMQGVWENFQGGTVYLRAASSDF